MTAINVLLQPDLVVIVTDTRARTGMGPDFEAAKVLPMPHLHLAVATRGPMDALIKVAAAIGVGAKGYDEARAFLAEAYGRLGLDDVEVVVAGWGEKGPGAFIVSKANTAGQVMEIGHLLVTPSVSADAFEEFAADPVVGMPALLARQAAQSADVGGFINVTQIGPQVIESYCAGRIATCG